MNGAGGVRIGSRAVGAGEPVFVIAEAGVNHNGDLAVAHRLIDVALEARADAVKFQAFVTEDLITSETPKAGYQVETTGSGSQHEMLMRLELGVEQHAELKVHCDRAGLLYLCTPYDPASVDMLARLDVAAFKVASTDTTNVPLLRHIASKQRPVILSTGMSQMSEVEESVETLRASAIGELVLLQCTSEYPTPVEDLNLRTIATLQRAFGCPVGFSDHTDGVSAAQWAVAVGACVVEKHLTLDRRMSGPDHRTSLEPSEFATFVEAIRSVEVALGDGVKRVMPSERANKAVMQKSLVAARALRAGERFDKQALTCKRPATGLPPVFFDRVVERRTARDIAADEILFFESIDWEDT